MCKRRKYTEKKKFVFQRAVSEKDKSLNYWEEGYGGRTCNNSVLVLYISHKSLLTPVATSFLVLFFFLKFILSPSQILLSQSQSAVYDHTFLQ